MNKIEGAKNLNSFKVDLDKFCERANMIGLKHVMWGFQCLMSQEEFKRKLGLDGILVFLTLVRKFPVSG